MLQNIGLGKDFLSKTSKAQSKKANMDKWDHIKLKSLFISKETINTVKTQSREWEKIFANYPLFLISDHKLKSLITTSMDFVINNHITFKLIM